MNRFSKNNTTLRLTEFRQGPRRIQEEDADYDGWPDEDDWDDAGGFDKYDDEDYDWDDDEEDEDYEE